MKHLPILLLASVIILSSCKKEEPEVIPTVQDQLTTGTSISDLLNEYPVDSLYGKYYQGGLICYVDESDASGMIVSPEDVSETANWGCNPEKLSGADSTALGTGWQNTIDILNECSETTSAAYACDQYVNDGYNDWFLPSLDELSAVYDNLPPSSLAEFADANFYWSSSQISFNTAYHFNFINGNFNFSTKSNIYFVRAMRTF